MIEVLGFKKYDIKETADLLQFTPRTIQKYIDLGKLPAKKIGKKWYIDEEVIRKYLQGPTLDN